MINCLKGSIHALMKVLISSNDDDYEEVVNHVDGHIYDVTREEEEEEDAKEDEGQMFGEILILKSSLRKVDSNSTEAEKKEKKKVQWLDVMGKDLAEIREFESSEEDDLNSDRGKTCVCVIL